MAETPKKHRPHWWQPGWEFVVHVVVGTVIFAILFVPAIMIEFKLRELKEANGISQEMEKIISWTKVSVAAIDAFVYVVFMLNMAWVFLGKLKWRPTDGEE